MQRSAKTIDMLNGSLWNRLIYFALPVSATSILEQLFNASDVAIVGNFTGEISTACVAAVGANSPVISLLVNLFLGISLGANVVIANAIGRDHPDDVKKGVHTSFVISILGGILLTIIGELIARPILSLLLVPEDVFDLALLYLRIYLLGLPVIFLYNFESAILRSIGDTRTPLIALALSGILNVLLNLFFVIVLHMNVDGVAIATVSANAISALILFFVLLRTDSVVRLDLRALKIDWPILGKIFQIGMPAGIQGATFSVSNIVIQAAINSLGTVVIAASSAAFNIECISYYFITGFSQACTTFVGQNYGAGKLDRCKKTLLLSLLEAGIALAISIGLTLLFGRQILAFFDDTPEVIEIGYIRLVVILSAYFFSMTYEMASSYLRGFGISTPPALLTILGVCGIRIFWISVIFPMNPTFTNIMLVYPVSLGATMLLLLGCLLYYRPAKKLRK